MLNYFLTTYLLPKFNAPEDEQIVKSIALAFCNDPYGLDLCYILMKAGSKQKSYFEKIAKNVTDEQVHLLYSRIGHERFQEALDSFVGFGEAETDLMVKVSKQMKKKSSEEDEQNQEDAHMYKVWLIKEYID